MSDKTRQYLYEFLAAPAHGWLWLVGRLFGMRFEWGWTDDEGNFL